MPDTMTTPTCDTNHCTQRPIHGTKRCNKHLRFDGTDPLNPPPPKQPTARKQLAAHADNILATARSNPNRWQKFPLHLTKADFYELSKNARESHRRRITVIIGETPGWERIETATLPNGELQYRYKRPKAKISKTDGGWALFHPDGTHGTVYNTFTAAITATGTTT